MRFELCAQALDATITTIAPWREPEFLERFKGRTDLLEYAAAHNIHVSQSSGSSSMAMARRHAQAEGGAAGWAWAPAGAAV